MQVYLEPLDNQLNCQSEIDVIGGYFDENMIFQGVLAANRVTRVRRGSGSMDRVSVGLSSGHYYGVILVFFNVILDRF